MPGRIRAPPNYGFAQRVGSTHDTLVGTTNLSAFDLVLVNSKSWRCDEGCPPTNPTHRVALSAGPALLSGVFDLLWGIAQPTGPAQTRTIPSVS